MISASVSLAVIGLLTMLGIHLTPQQTLMVGGAVVLVVKIFLVLGGYALVTRLAAWFKRRSAAPPSPAAPAEADETR